MGEEALELGEPMPTWQLAWLTGSVMGILGGAILALAALFPWVRSSPATNGYICTLLQVDYIYLIVFILPLLGIAIAVLCVFSLLRNYLDAIAAARMAAAGCIIASATLALVTIGTILVTMNLLTGGAIFGVAPFFSIFGSILAFVGCLLIFLDSRQGGGVVKEEPRSRRRATAQTRCPHCGSEAMAEWTLCPICGKPLGSEKRDDESE